MVEFFMFTRFPKSKLDFYSRFHGGQFGPWGKVPTSAELLSMSVPVNDHVRYFRWFTFIIHLWLLPIANWPNLIWILNRSQISSRVMVKVNNRWNGRRFWLAATRSCVLKWSPSFQNRHMHVVVGANLAIRDGTTTEISNSKLSTQC